MGFSSAPSTRAKGQRNHVQYEAKEFRETIYTRLDAFGRVFGPVLDGVDDGGLVVEKRLNDEEEMWSANGSEKKEEGHFPMMH